MNRILAIEEVTDRIFYVNDTIHLLFHFELINRTELNYVIMIGNYSSLMQSSIVFDKILENLLTGHPTYSDKYKRFMDSHWILRYLYKDYASKYITTILMYLIRLCY